MKPTSISFPLVGEREKNNGNSFYMYEQNIIFYKKVTLNLKHNVPLVYLKHITLNSLFVFYVFNADDIK
jgi:hypothetical protein